MRTIFTLIAFAVFISASGQDENVDQSHWRDSNTNIRQLPNDNFGFFKKGNFFYYISNDKDNLYIDIKIEDSGVEYKILQEGLTVWFNADGKQRKEVGIRYPIGAKLAKGPGMRNPGAESSSSPLAMANTIQLTGFGEERPVMIPSKNEDNINGLVEYDKDGNLFYSLKMPLTRLALVAAKEGSGFEPFTIGIEYGGMPEIGQRPSAPQAPSQMSMPSTGRGGGGGSRGGGGRGGASAGSIGAGPSGPPAATAETSKLLWIKKISLAVQP